MLVVPDLNDFRPRQVYRGGQLVAEDGAMVIERMSSRASKLPGSVNIDRGSLDFGIPARGGNIRVIGKVVDQVYTQHLVERAKVVDGCAVSDVERDILKFAMIERHHASGNIGLGFIRGFGLKRGAIAGTVAHDHHNLAVIGVDDASMKTAALTLADMGGGLVAVDGGEALASLPLPVAGLISDAPIEEVRAGYDRMAQAARDMGSEIPDAFMVMSFMGLEVIPKLKLTDHGLVDVERFEVVDLFVD